MNQKGFTNIVLIVVIAILVGAGGYFAFVKKSEPVSQQQLSPATVNETAGWKTYKNDTYNFEVKYPENVTLKKDMKTDCTISMGSVSSPGRIEATTLNAGVPIPLIFATHIEEQVLFSGNILNQRDKCLNAQLSLISFGVISKPENFTGLEAYVNNEKTKADAFEKKLPSAAGQNFSVRVDAIGNEKAVILTASDMSAHLNTQEALYLERGNKIYYMGINYSAVDAGLSGYIGLTDDNASLLYKISQNIAKTFKYIN